MMRILSTVLLFSFCASAAWAQEMAVSDVNASPVIDKEVCQYLTTYKQPVGVEYQPGVDVQGNPVIEADVSPSIAVKPDEFSFEITVDTAKYMGITIPNDALLGEAKFGTVKYENGSITFNGQPLAGPSEESLISLCSDQPTAAPANSMTAPPPVEEEKTATAEPAPEAEKPAESAVETPVETPAPAAESAPAPATPAAPTTNAP